MKFIISRKMQNPGNTDEFTVQTETYFGSYAEVNSYCEIRYGVDIKKGFIGYVKIDILNE